MSKPEILGAVRVGRTTYVAGQEDAFAAAASPAEIARLTEKKAIKGFSANKSPEPAPKAEAAPAPAGESADAAAPVGEVEAEEEKPKGKGKTK